jgi:SAM-dependent methyltransferase
MPVFISYSSTNRRILNDTLIRELNSQRVSYWSDRGIENGEDIPKKLRQMIQECEACILLTTLDSLKSLWCNMEIAAFWSAGKRLFLYSPDGSITLEDLPPYLRNLNYNGTLEEIVESALQEIEKLAIKGPPELIEEAKKLSAMIEPSKIGGIQALNESQPMLKVVLEYFAATRNNIEQLKSENCHVSVPATEYPNYLISLQKMPSTYVKAVAIVDDVEKFWDSPIADNILRVSTREKTKRVFIFKEQKYSKQLRSVIREHWLRYDVRLTSKDSVQSKILEKNIHDFSLIWSSNADANPTEPPSGTILAQYSKLHGNIEIEFSSESNVVRTYWKIFLDIYDNAIIPDQSPDPDISIGRAISLVFGLNNKEMSHYIEVEKYDRCEKLHPYFTEMRNEMLKQLIEWQKPIPKIWEVGAGTGILSQEILTILSNRNDGSSLESIEYDSEYFIYLSNKLKIFQPRLKLSQEDAKRYDPSGKFDLIFSSFADHHIVRTDDEAKRYYENIRKNLFDGSFFIVGDEFLREHDRTSNEDRIEAIKAYHNHIIEQARIEMTQAPADRHDDYQGFIELETEARESGIRAVQNPTFPDSGDYKVSISHFKQRIKRAGLHIDSIVPIGPQDESIRERVGGIYVIKIRLP